MLRDGLTPGREALRHLSSCLPKGCEGESYAELCQELGIGSPEVLRQGVPFHTRAASSAVPSASWRQRQQSTESPLRQEQQQQPGEHQKHHFQQQFQPAPKAEQHSNNNNNNKKNNNNNNKTSTKHVQTAAKPEVQKPPVQVAAASSVGGQRSRRLWVPSTEQLGGVRTSSNTSSLDDTDSLHMEQKPLVPTVRVPGFETLQLLQELGAALSLSNAGPSPVGAPARKVPERAKQRRVAKTGSPTR